MDSVERQAWSAVDVFSVDAAAYFLTDGLPRTHPLQQAIIDKMQQDYKAALSRAYESALVHLSERDERSYQVPDTGVEAVHLQSIGLQEVLELAARGEQEPEEVATWCESEFAGFDRQRFSRAALLGWAELKFRGGGTSSERPLPSRERSSLYRIIAILCDHAGLDLAHHSTAARRILDMAAQTGTDLGQRTVEKHLRMIHEQVGRLRGHREDDD